ncbi:MAG: trypsin-like serine protease [Prevotellaceae bacterium]|nr:trypsin-like serine protease [Prevotellaceae bacterium]
MKRFLFIYFILIFSSLYSQSRIIGGDEIDIEDAPWMANMRIVNLAGVRLFDRSGIIVSENLVLTASHNFPDYEYDHLEVHVGGASESAGKYHRVHRVISHPNKDIILLELSEPLNFNKNIQSIDYKSCSDESLYAPETKAVVYGWGKTIPDAPLQSFRLRAVDVRIISQDEANKIYGAAAFFGNAIVTVGETAIGMGGKGDSGGPIVVRNAQQKPVLAGVTIYADTRPIDKNSGLTVYSKVKPIIEWIDSCKCEIVGNDAVSPLGTSFGIVNMPPEVLSVEWTYSGLTEVNSTMDCIDVISSEIDKETKGYISATITTNLGSLSVNKALTIMPRIDVDVNVKYNEITAKYEMTAKTVNMETVDEMDILKCKNIMDEVKLLGFVWTYNKDIAIGQEVVFDINPNPPITHTISVSKYDCDHTVQLNKTFIIQHLNNEFITVYNEPGTITVGSMSLPVNADVDVYEELQMTYTRNSIKDSVLLNTSDVMVEYPSKNIVDMGKYKVALFSRKGTLLYSRNFDTGKGPLYINTSTFCPDIYILYIRNLDTNNVTSRMLIIW